MFNKEKQDNLKHNVLLTYLTYNSETGIFQHNINNGSAKKGSRAGTLSKAKGYRVITLKGIKYQEHRLVWFYTYKVWPEKQIDHINGIKDDNRIINLREATGTQNQGNRKSANNSSSQYKGVYWSKQAKKWQVQIRSKKDSKYLGLYTDEIEAAKAYNEVAIKQFGDFALINKVPN